jgi:ParB family transcriptional regulator, chromosome partitioning protein
MKKTLQTIYEIPVKEIEISENNVRESRATTDLDELADSIKLMGLLQPVVLKGEFGKPKYELIGGQRRLLAHQKLGRKTIPAVFAGKDLTKTDIIIRSLVENLQRVELEYEDTAKAVTYLYRKFDNDEYEVAKHTGLSVRKVRDFVEIEARATPAMKRLLQKRAVSASDVKRAIRAAKDNMDKAEELLDLIIEHKPTAHQKRRLVAYAQQHTSASAKKILTEAMKPAVEQNLVISLPTELIDALKKATKSLKIEADELATQILTEWLENQGFAS